MKKRWICLILAAAMLFACAPAAHAAYTEMAFSDNVVEFIKKGEGFLATPYASGGYWYIGYGCLINPADYPNGPSSLNRAISMHLPATGVISNLKSAVWITIPIGVLIASAAVSGIL